MEYNHAILYFFFPLQEKLCRNNAKYIFGGVLHVVGHTFFYAQKIFSKTFEKNISIINF